MCSNHDWETFERNRLRLTKLWLLLVACNVLLQTDVAEEFFCKSESQATVKVVSQLECSSFLGIAAPEQKEQEVLGQRFFPIGLTSRGEQKLSVLQPFNTQSDSHRIERTNFVDIFKFTKAIDLSLVSGLSPPLSA